MESLSVKSIATIFYIFRGFGRKNAFVLVLLAISQCCFSNSFRSRDCAHLKISKYSLKPGDPCSLNNLCQQECGEGLRCKESPKKLMLRAGAGECVDVQEFGRVEQRVLWNTSVPDASPEECAECTWFNVTANDTNLRAAVNAGMRIYNQNQHFTKSEPLLVLEIIRAAAQIVGGINYAVLLSTLHGHCGKVGTASARTSYFFHVPENKGCTIESKPMQMYNMQVFVGDPTENQGKLVYSLSLMQPLEGALPHSSPLPSASNLPQGSPIFILLAVFGVLIVFTWLGSAVCKNKRVPHRDSLVMDAPHEIPGSGVFVIPYQSIH